MTRDEILKAFAELSAEEQEAVREGIAGKTAGGTEEESSPADMCGEIMGKFKEGGDPMAICKEMMAKCCCG